MGKFDGLLLVSDFDDTLYDFQHRVPPRNIEAIRYWIQEGGRFTVATGRAHRTFAPYAHLAPINAPVVLSNGSAIYDFQREEMLVQTLLDPRAPEDFAALMEAIPSLGLAVYAAGLPGGLYSSWVSRTISRQKVGHFCGHDCGLCRALLGPLYQRRDHL